MEVEKTKSSKRRLGRGLDSLLQNPQESNDPIRQKLIKTEKKEETKAESNHVMKLNIEKIHPNPDQPRTAFDKAQLEQLANSIKEKGIIQPIVVQPNADKNYLIVAGERRWRAAQIAGLHQVPVVVRDFHSDVDTLELALIENVQREDLNPIEEAEAYKNLQEKYGYTQVKIAEKIGKERATIANSIRLLGLHKDIQTMVIDKKISVGHAKALLSIPEKEKQLSIAKKIVAKKLNVRKAEKLIQGKPQADSLDVDISDKLVSSLADDLQKLLSRKVKIDYKNKKGKLSIYFYSDEELTEIVDSVKKGWKRATDAN